MAAHRAEFWYFRRLVLSRLVLLYRIGQGHVLQVVGIKRNLHEKRVTIGYLPGHEIVGFPGEGKRQFGIIRRTLIPLGVHGLPVALVIANVLGRAGALMPLPKVGRPVFGIGGFQARRSWRPVGGGRFVGKASANFPTIDGDCPY